MSMLIDWNGVRDFVAIVEAGNLTRAATALRVSQATLSRRLAAFEQQIGAQLLIRGPRHLELTEAGQRILEAARRMSRDAGEIPAAALDTSGSMQGTVRVSTTEAFSSMWLAEHLYEFCDLYPGITIELIADNHLTDLLGRDADIAVRLLRPTQQDLITRRVGTLRTGFYASENYVQRNGLPKRQSDLHSHRLIAMSGRRKFAADVEARIGRGNVVLRVRNLQVAYAAIRGGIGIGPMYHYIGDRENDLVRVLEDEPDITMDIWLTALPELNDNVRVRILYDYLASAFLQQRRLFG